MKLLTTSTPVVDEQESGTIVGLDPTKFIRRDELVSDMSSLLWPEANEELKDGPWDGIYRQLSPESIDSLIAFWKARKEPFPYESEAWDCDNFALEFFYLAQCWNMRTESYMLPPPPVVGIALIHVDGYYDLFSHSFTGDFYHAINVIQRDDGQWLFFEPQNGRMMPIDGSIYEGAIEVVRIIL